MAAAAWKRRQSLILLHTGRWRTKEVVVGDGHPWTRVGQKVMVRPSLKHQRGFQRMCGIGQLVRPEKSFGGRWYVKFPCTPEVLLSTGRHGNHELMFVLDLLNHEMNDAETRVHERLWMEQDNVFLEQAQQFASIAPRSRRGIDEEDEEEANDLASAPSVSVKACPLPALRPHHRRVLPPLTLTGARGNLTFVVRAHVVERRQL